MSTLEKHNSKNTKSKAGAFIKRGITKTANFVLGGLEKELKLQDAQDKKNRANAPVGAYGGTNTGAVKFPSNIRFKK